MMRRLRVLLVGSLCALFLMQVASAFGAVQVESLAFTSATEGFVGGGYTVTGGARTGFVARTTDGGYTWRSARIASAWPVSLDAFGTNVWTAASFSRYLYRSIDSGTSWTKSSGALPYNARPTRVLRLYGGRTLIVGSHEGTVQSDSQPHGRVAFVATTNDEGSSWTRRYEGPLYFASGEDDMNPPTEAAFADVGESPSGSTLWAVGNEWTRGGASLTYKQRLVLKSTDAGATWASTGTLPKHSPQRIITAVAAPAEDTVLVFGENRQYLKSTDSGGTWSALNLTAATGVREINVRAADALDANRIVVAGDMTTRTTGPWFGMVGITTDGGSTWEYRPFPGVASLRAIEMLSATHWIAVGGNEVILHTTDAGATWTGQSGFVAPELAMASPIAKFTPTAAPVSVSGTSTDIGVGVAGVDVRIRRADGKYWNGLTWIASETWLPASSSDNWRTWAYSWTPDAATLASRMVVTISARAVDGCGNLSVPRTVASAGRVAAYVGVPGGLPSTAIRSRTYKISGTLKPQHTVGSVAVRIAAERWERQRNGTYKWVTRKTVSAKAAKNYRYAGSLSLPYAGKWRVRAYHPSDTAHITSYSGYRSVTVR